MPAGINRYPLDTINVRCQLHQDIILANRLGGGWCVCEEQCQWEAEQAELDRAIKNEEAHDERR